MRQPVKVDHGRQARGHRGTILVPDSLPGLTRRRPLITIVELASESGSVPRAGLRRARASCHSQLRVTDVTFRGKPLNSVLGCWPGPDERPASVRSGGPRSDVLLLALSRTGPARSGSYVLLQPDLQAVDNMQSRGVLGGRICYPLPAQQMLFQIH